MIWFFEQFIAFSSLSFIWTLDCCSAIHIITIFIWICLDSEDLFQALLCYVMAFLIKSYNEPPSNLLLYFNFFMHVRHLVTRPPFWFGYLFTMFTNKLGLRWFLLLCWSFTSVAEISSTMPITTSPNSSFSSKAWKNTEISSSGFNESKN